MMKVDMLLKNGRIVTTEEIYSGAIGVKDGKIAFIASDDSDICADNVIDLSGKYILPGAIDPHIHFQDPGFTDREDFEHGTMAAAAGGITTVLSHPLDFPPTTTFEALSVKEEAYEGKAYVDYANHIGATSDNLDILPDLWMKTGATSIKMFMCFSVAEFPYVEDDALYKAMKSIASMNGLAIIHAENNGLLNVASEEIKKTGRNDGMAYNLSHPKAAEIEAIRRVIYYAELTGAECVILHVSTAEGLELIHEAKEKGLKIWAESSPHLFQFIDEDMIEKGPYLKFSPVMHDDANRKKMWELLGKGYVDYIGSDHSPYTLEEKKVGEDDIWKAPNGIPGVETSLAVFLNGVNEGKLTLPQLVKMTSANTAKIYGLSPEKGNMTVGTDADFTIVDLGIKKSIKKEELKSKCKWTPFFGVELKGWPVMTIVRGNVIYKDGEIIGKKGFGQYLHRRK